MNWSPRSPAAHVYLRSQFECFSGFIAEKAKMGFYDASWTDGVSEWINLLRERAREIDAEQHWGAAKVQKCNDCLGNGFVVMCAGDGEWDSKCEKCEGTGFVPVSFEP